MKPNFDDSITGFNEAWGIVRKRFAEVVAPAPADQNDAGRDGVIEECAKIAERQEEIERELRMAANKSTADADAAAYHLWAEQSAAIVKRQIRALASAPSETVGRGEGQEYRNPRNVALDQGYGRPTPNEALSPQKLQARITAALALIGEG